MIKGQFILSADGFAALRCHCERMTQCAYCLVHAFRLLLSDWDVIWHLSLTTAETERDWLGLSSEPMHQQSMEHALLLCNLLRQVAVQGNSIFIQISGVWSLPFNCHVRFEQPSFS